MNGFEKATRELMGKYLKRQEDLVNGEQEAREDGDDEAKENSKMLQRQCRIMIAELFQMMKQTGILDKEEIETGLVKKDEFIRPKFLDEQWVLRYDKNRYIQYDYRKKTVTQVASLRSATVISEDPMFRLGKEFESAVEAAGLDKEKLSWKKVYLRLVFPNDRTTVSLTDFSLGFGDEIRDVEERMMDFNSSVFSDEEIEKTIDEMVRERKLNPKPEEPKIRRFVEGFIIREDE